MLRNDFTECESSTFPLFFMFTARSGTLDYEVALNLTSYLTKEKEYVPWMSALDNMGYFAIQFSTYDSLKGSSDYYPTYKVIEIIIYLQCIFRQQSYVSFDV